MDERNSRSNNNIGSDITGGWRGHTWCCIFKRTAIIVLFCALLVAAIINARSTNNEVIYLRNSLAQFTKDFTSTENFRDLNVLMNEAHERVKQVQETLNEIENSNRIPNELKLFTFDRPDLALINSGGRVVGIGKGTKLFYSCNLFSKLLGCPNKRNSPERALESSMHPGDCFGFLGDKATLYIRLIGPAVVDSVTIEHIQKQISPTGDVSDAPRKFSVYAFNEISEASIAMKLGNFIFNANDTAIRTFKFDKLPPTPSKYMKIEFHENNGNPEKTCVYRFRVHGVVLNDVEAL